MRSALAFMFVLASASSGFSQSFSWQLTPTGSQASLRGVATASNKDQSASVIWASGTHGTVIKLVGQQAAESVGPAAYPQLDFRSIFAWNEQEAIIASAGTPAVVLKTVDGGKTWREVFKDDRPAAFFDGLKFLDAKRGVLFGDPIDGHFCVFTSNDTGQSWMAVAPQSLPEVLPGEAAFAASNSAMIVIEPSTILIGTGGAERNASRVYCSDDFGASWQTIQCPLVSHKSAGVFSLAVNPASKSIVAVGGDYEPNATSATTSAIAGSERKFTLSQPPAAAYRSAVVYTAGNATTEAGFYAVGPSGTDYSIDGSSWKTVSETGFHALAVLPDQSLVASGSAGRIAVSRRR